MNISRLSVIREAEYKALQNLELNGVILDVGGGSTSEYHQLLQGEHTFYAINISEQSKPDTLVDIEKTFPLENARFDHAICMNVLEHVFEFENVIRETSRVVKPGGSIILATPFLYKIHGSPDDYLRYTASAFRRIAQKYELEIVTITPLGFGFFSAGIQLLRPIIPAGFLWVCAKRITMTIDGVCNKIVPGYKTLSNQIPLGYVTHYKNKK
jgi:SAM-dependent methyltransferase